LVYDDEVYGTHGLYWEKKYTETGKVPTEFTNIGETPVENYFLTNAERDVTKWSWGFDKDKKTNAWYYDNKPSSKSPTVIDSDLTKEAQTEQIEAFNNNKGKLYVPDASEGDTRKTEEEAAETNIQNAEEEAKIRKVLADADKATERERLKTLETERLKANELAEKNSWKTIYTPDNAIKWQKNNETATFNPPESATFEELVASKWKWTKITENGKVKIKWNNTVDQKKGKRPDDIITDDVGQFPIIHNSPITKQAQTQQQAAAKSQLPPYGKTLYQNWLKKLPTATKDDFIQYQDNPTTPQYHFKNKLESINSKDELERYITELKSNKTINPTLIKDKVSNADTFIENLGKLGAIKIGTILMTTRKGGSSKTTKNHMKINKKTRKNVHDYATKGGTFTTKTIRSKKSKFRHTRKDKAR
jgi:hypothetical protein